MNTLTMSKFDYKNIKQKENNFSAPLAFEIIEEKRILSNPENGKFFKKIDIKAYAREEND